jgi:hypothetical protein
MIPFPVGFMPNMHMPMKLSRDEKTFLRHWMYDAAHFQEGLGAAKRSQLEQRAIPADLALLIAAAFPNIADQAAAGSVAPTAGAPRWPWSDKSLQNRLAEARQILGARSNQTNRLDKSA